MKIKATRCFYDLKEDKYRDAGDEFEVTKARLDELNKIVAGIVEEIEEEKKTTSKK